VKSSFAARTVFLAGCVLLLLIALFFPGAGY
jgi:hypothetical protein